MARWKLSWSKGKAVEEEKEKGKMLLETRGILGHNERGRFRFTSGTIINGFLLGRKMPISLLSPNG
jgi:hypothetical protein